MKKLLYCAAALAMLLFAGSCQRENLEPAAGSGTVTFTVKAPDALVTKGTINDGATIADGENVNVVHYALYKTNDDEPNALEGTDGPLAQGKVEMKNKQATAKFDLLQDQEYTILFWAQVTESEDGMNAFYELGDLREITLKKNSENEYDGNNEKRAAFYARYDFSTENHMDHTVTLYRPFSQLNLLTTMESLEPKYEGQTSASVTIDVEESMVTVHGTSSTFDMINGTGLAGEDQTFSMYATPAKQGQETLAVNEVAYHYVSMNYLFVPDDEALLTVDYEIVTDKGKVNNTVLNVPLKENYRTNIIGNLLTKETQFNIVVDQRFNEEIDDNLSSENIYLTDVNTDEDLEKALRRTEEHIVIDLGAETTVKSGVEPKEYSVNISSAVEKYYFGGPDTKSITINANGNKINFIQNDGDWNYIRCVNEDAKWVINDAVLTNSGKNDGPWNRHDIRFYNAVELNNVTSDKAIALLNDGKLNNVTISEETGVYCLWITADGQSVDIDGLDITATNDGRGIAIKDEYVDNPAIVKLNVKNAKFTTASKAAVLVTSTAGAEITWGEGNNINGVAADPVNAVWVDEERSDYYDEVVVTGATKILEGAAKISVITTAEQFREALKTASDGDFIVLADGTYEGLFVATKGINLSALNKGQAVIDGKLGISAQGKDVNITGITFTNAYDGDVTVPNSNIDDGKYCITLYCASVNVKDCTFNLAKDGAINFDAINKVDYCTVDNCTFNCNGFRPILSQDHVSITNNTFNDQYRYAVQIYGNECDGSGNVVFKGNKIVNPCQTSGKPFAAGISISGSKSFYNSSIEVADNTIESSKFPELVYTWEPAKNPANLVDMSKVNVVGAEFITEKEAETNEYVKSQEEFEAALAGSGDVKIFLYNPSAARSVGASYTWKATSKNVTVIGKEEGIAIDFTSFGYNADLGNTVSFENLTLNLGNELYRGFHHSANETYKNCVINGVVQTYAPVVSFDGCTFDQDGKEYNVRIYGTATVDFKDCDFTSNCKSILIYSEGAAEYNVTIDKCSFNAENFDGKAAVQMHTEYGVYGTLTIKDTEVTGNYADINGGYYNEINKITGEATSNFKVTIDGLQYIAPGLAKNSDGHFFVSSAEGLAKMNEMFKDESAGRDAVLNLTSDIDFAGHVWTPVDSHADTAFEIAEINGNGHTISNLTINGRAMFTRFAGSGDVVVKDITFDNATVTSTSLNTSILTVQSYQNVLLDNVDVRNSNITGTYKVAPLIATVYNESASSTITATLKNCDVENVTVKATLYDFCTAGMVAFVNASDNDKIEFENCTVKNVKLIAPDDGYKAHAAIYTTGSDSLYNEAEGVTVTNVTFETLQ